MAIPLILYTNTLNAVNFISDCFWEQGREYVQRTLKEKWPELLIYKEEIIKRLFEDQLSDIHIAIEIFSKYIRNYPFSQR